MLYINKVEKTIEDGNTTVFIIRTIGDEDNRYWWWQVHNDDIRDYFKKHSTGTGLVIALNGHITPTAAEIFVNDIRNTDKGTSGSDYKTIDEIINEFR